MAGTSEIDPDDDGAPLEVKQIDARKEHFATREMEREHVGRQNKRKKVPNKNSLNQVRKQSKSAEENDNIESVSEDTLQRVAEIKSKLNKTKDFCEVVPKAKKIVIRSSDQGTGTQLETRHDNFQLAYFARNRIVYGSKPANFSKDDPVFDAVDFARKHLSGGSYSRVRISTHYNTKRSNFRRFPRNC